MISHHKELNSNPIITVICRSVAKGNGGIFVLIPIIHVVVADIVASRHVFKRLLEGAKLLKCSESGDAIIKNM